MSAKMTVKDLDGPLQSAQESVPIPEVSAPFKPRIEIIKPQNNSILNKIKESQ